MLGVYFSGTGNTKYILGQFLSEQEESSMCSITDSDAVQAIIKADKVVFAYPGYFSNLPVIVRKFICEHKKIWEGKQIYIIVTMGAFCGDGTGCAARLFRKYGATILGGIQVRMPDSICDKKQYLKSFEFNQKLVQNAIEKVEKESQKMKQGKPSREGLGFFAHVAGLLGERLWFYSKSSKLSDKLNIDTTKCVGCENCVGACPMGNIEMVNGKPTSQGKCTMCYSCISQCPEEAITLLGNQILSQHRIEKYIHL